jgi:hypothetical protein
VSSAVYNRNARCNLGPTLGVALGALVLSGLLMLLFAIEGILCLLMAAPIALVLGLLGAVVGWASGRNSAAALGSMHAVATPLAMVLLSGHANQQATPELNVTTRVQVIGSSTPMPLYIKSTSGFWTTSEG